MCGRYRLKDPKKAFDWMEVVPSSNFLPRFNIAPTQCVPVVAALGRVEQMRWGIVPVWAKETSKALINARSESIREKRSFKSAFASRRCLVPADGFYEWTKVERRPHFFSVGAGGPFAIAGIWDTAEEMSRCCFLTTSANSVLQPIHDRMPVIVRRADWEEWLSTGELGDKGFERITAPYAGEEMSALPVSPLVNSAKVDDPKCCEGWDSARIDIPSKVKMMRKEPAKTDSQQTFGF